MPPLAELVMEIAPICTERLSLAHTGTDEVFD